MGVPMLFYASKHRHVAGLWQVLELGRVNMGKTTIIQPIYHCPSCKLVPEQTAQNACPTKWSAPPTVLLNDQSKRESEDCDEMIVPMQWMLN